ncbi:hypothetical protein JK635_07595 [Neobacillus sp. YIM B02564]|uniref:Uncharacterized protein n=1 Tax=Neobacillus paridis TaxID=2803862 RepID=A0ABS1TL85_9BACI|nr:hypothetical protein [Neobacillus paridis]MBL4952072.1 hypothetical protein [Neobacillus paridis]
MTVKDLIEELQKYNPNAQVVTISVGNRNEWNYTDNPKLTSSKNMFGERVFIN